MSTARVLAYLFPGISAPDDFALNKQGALLYWRRPEPQPTPAQIAAAALPAAKAAKKREIKQAARARILARYPEWMQANLTARAVELVSLGQTTGPEWGQMQAIWNWIKATRARSDLLEADVAACTTVAAVDAVQLSGWPE